MILTVILKATIAGINSQNQVSTSFGKHRSKSTSTAALLQKSGININQEKDWGGCLGISMDSESKENARPDVSIIEYNGFKIFCRMIMSIPFQKFWSRDIQC